MYRRYCFLLVFFLCFFMFACFHSASSLREKPAILYQPYVKMLPFRPELPRTGSSIPNTSTRTGLAPIDIIRAYNVDKLHAAQILGQGQTIALVALDGFRASDVQQYFQSYHLPLPKISTVLVDNYSGVAGQGALEVALDIEMLGVIVPHAHIIVYEGPPTLEGMNAILTQIIKERKARFVSISWGLCETSMGNAQLETLRRIFAQGAQAGISFFAASGDAGAYDCHDQNLAVSSPASDPNVLAVGATTLQLDNGKYSSESVWFNPQGKLRGPLGTGSGGGLSSFHPRPSWQVGPGIQNDYSNGKRQVPDVVAFGDMQIGFSIYCTVKNAGCPATGWTKVGGTSVATPFWAASMALVNQYLQMQKQPPLGPVAPELYRLFSSPHAYPAFQDITTGHNLYYPATLGYDLASGMGSPNVYNIARNLAMTRR